MNRTDIADLILKRVNQDLKAAKLNWNQTAPIHHFVVDDLLPRKLALEMYQAYPKGSQMRVRKSLRELKYIAAQMDQYNPLLEESLFAFQDPRVVQLISEITGIQSLEPDELLYAGGISMMAQGHYLNPHLDNSHDKDRKRYRSLNLLYYVSPEWKLENGGNLELWPKGVRAEPLTIESRFNRLVCMVTHEQSWHSVSKVVVKQPRCCISNYYFSQQPVAQKDYFHVTSFRGRPEEPIRDLLLRADVGLRTLIRKVFKKGVVSTKHFYEKKRDTEIDL